MLQEDLRHRQLAGRGTVPERRAGRVHRRIQSGDGHRLVRIEPLIQQLRQTLGLIVRHRLEQRTVGPRRFRAGALGPPPLFLLDDRHNLRVAAVGRDRARAGGVAVRVDSLPRVRAVRHQQADHLRRAIEHRMVQRAMLVVGRRVEVDEFRTLLDQRSCALEVAGMHGVDQLVEVGHGELVRVHGFSRSWQAKRSVSRLPTYPFRHIVDPGPLKSTRQGMFTIVPRLRHVLAKRWGRETHLCCRASRFHRRGGVRRHGHDHRADNRRACGHRAVVELGHRRDPGHRAP
jgi:hypothetical protein